MGVVKIEATRAKAAFSKLQERAKSSDVAITKHGRVQAYVVSPERYRTLHAVSHIGEDLLQKLEGEFSELVAGMQRAPHRRAVQQLETRPLEQILEKGAQPKKARKRRAVAARRRSR